MKQEAFEALEKSIAHWERLVACKTKKEIKAEGIGPEKCALCQLYNNSVTPLLKECIECPVSEVSGRKHCDNTPYIDASFQYEDTLFFNKTAWQKFATLELEFLKGLLPKDA